MVLRRSLLYLKKSVSMNVGDDSRKKEKDIRNVLESAIPGTNENASFMPVLNQSDCEFQLFQPIRLQGFQPIVRASHGSRLII